MYLRGFQPQIVNASHIDMKAIRDFCTQSASDFTPPGSMRDSACVAHSRAPMPRYNPHPPSLAHHPFPHATQPSLALHIRAALCEHNIGMLFWTTCLLGLAAAAPAPQSPAQRQLASRLPSDTQHRRLKFKQLNCNINMVVQNLTFTVWLLSSPIVDIQVCES